MNPRFTGKRHTPETIQKMKLAQQGEKSHFWRGGRQRKEGYVMIWKPDHPFANSKLCVAEHRLVMEEYLGRYLRKDEDVHHVNGIRDDNRIENLELLTHSKHAIITHTKDMSKRICLICGDNKTNYNTRLRVYCWHKLGNNWQCHRCYERIRKRNLASQRVRAG